MTTLNTLPKKATLAELKTISDSNYGTYNRSIDVEALVKHLGLPYSTEIEVKAIMRHYFAKGEPTAPHYRTIVSVPTLGQTLTQDMTFTQYNNLDSFGYSKN